MGRKTSSKTQRLSRKRARKAASMKKGDGLGKSRYAQKLRLKAAGQQIGMWWMSAGAQNEPSAESSE